MSRGMSGVLAVARLDAAEVLRSRWLFACLGLYGFLLLLFVLVGLRESTVYEFTGAGRVLVSLTHALILLLPLLALTATGQVVNRSREDGTLELLLAQPLGRGTYFVAVTLVRVAALVLPLVVVMAAVAIYGRIAFGQDIPWTFLAHCVAVSAALLWCFAGVGLLLSTLVRHQAKAMLYVLLLWVASVSLVDFALAGLMLQWRLNPQSVFILAALNPVQDARLALLSAAEPELSLLGPVGFYLANRVGAGALQALGLVWPALVGSAAWLAALATFKRQDAT